MDIPFDTEWSDAARLTFNRLPVDWSADGRPLLCGIGWADQAVTKVG